MSIAHLRDICFFIQRCSFKHFLTDELMTQWLCYTFSILWPFWFFFILLCAEIASILIDQTAVVISLHIFVSSFSLRPRARYPWLAHWLWDCPGEYRFLGIFECTGRVFLSYSHFSHIFFVNKRDGTKIITTRTNLSFHVSHHILSFIIIINIKKWLTYWVYV